MDTVLSGSLQTILIVDDNPAVLKLVEEILSEAGYVTISARCAEDALILASTPAEIHLLLSDIDMPLMSGPELGQEMKKRRPNIHVMLMSGGGPDGNLLVLNYGWAFIAKPFVGEKLVHMVKDVLESIDRSQLGGKEFDARKDKA